MKKILFILLFLLSGNLLKSQQVDSLISLQNSPFLKDLIQRAFIADAVEIDNPYVGSSQYEMVGALGLRILKMDSCTYLHFNGSGLLYKLINTTDSTLIFKRIDKTNNYKYNINAFLFAHQGKVFNLGGYGFWRTTGTLRCFNEKNKEWDVVPTNEEIHIPIKTSLTSYYPEESKLFIPFQLMKNDGVKENKNAPTKDDNVYALNLVTHDWEKLGATDPELVNLLSETPWQLSTENGLLFSHKNMVYQLRYLTNEVYIYNENSSLSQTLERIYYDHYKYYVNGKMYYLNKKTGEYDSLKIPLKEFIKSDIQIWNNNKTKYAYGLIPVIALIIFFVLKSKRNRANSTPSNNNTSINSGSGQQNKSFAQTSFSPVIRFNETEKQLLQLLLEKSKQNRTTTITEINYVLGIKDKNISLQKKVRSEVVNSINEKFSFLYPTQNHLIGNIRSQEDKRYFEYFIDAKNNTFLEDLLKEA